MRILGRGLFAALLIVLFVFGALYFLFPEQVAQVAFNLERARSGLEHRELDLGATAESPALHVAYLEGGAAGAPALLLLHGIGADKDNWTRAAHFLTPRYHVFAIDLPGFGESSRLPDGSYHIDEQVRNVAAIAMALRLERFDLGGNSMGGWIAAAYAAAHPQQVSTLWLLDPAGVAGARPSEMYKRVKNGEVPPIFAARPDQFREVEHFVFTRPPYIPGAVLNLLARREARDYQHNLEVFGELRTDLEREPLESKVKDLATPSLIVWGGADRVLDVSGADVLHHLMPNSRVSIMPDIGHMPMIEASQISAENYLRFRDGLKAAAQPP